jgi:serine/threonine-protein kinase
MTLEAGRTLSHYRLVEQIGEGGMGAVWKAQDTRLDREVAIKILPESVSAEPERMARFDREARVLASLNHPSIAAIYSFEHAAPVHFLVMELAEGENLAARIARGPLPLHDALQIALQIAEALEAAHERGIVHRDLKPANVMVTAEGQVKVLDFGLAKALETGPGAGGQADLSHSPTLTAQVTQAGVILGTAAYMSPEQARGQQTDKRTDIWSFGVVLYEILTGSRLFQGASMTDVLAAVVGADLDLAELPDNVPLSIRDLLSRCIDRDAKSRLRDIGEARIRIAGALAGPEAAAAGIISPAPPLVAGHAASRPYLWGAMLVLLAAIAVGAIT